MLSLGARARCAPQPGSAGGLKSSVLCRMFVLRQAAFILTCFFKL